MMLSNYKMIDVEELSAVSGGGVGYIVGNVAGKLLQFAAVVVSFF